MFIWDFFTKKPRGCQKIAKKLYISPQAVCDSIKKAKRGDSRRITTIITYRLLKNAKDEVIDFLLDDDNFDINQKIKDNK